MRFNEILRELLSERGITQKQLARELGIPVSTLGGYVQGTSEPDFEMLKVLAGYFSVTTDYLLGMSASNTTSFREDTLLHIFRTLTCQEQEVYIEQGRAFGRARQKDGRHNAP